MKLFYLLLLLTFNFAYSCEELESLYPTLRDRELKEFVLRGSYNLKEEKLRPANYSPRHAMEPFNYSSLSYCYKETKKKKPVFDKGLRFRLYDKTGKILAEAPLRLDNDYGGMYPFQDVISYLPYHKKGHELRIVRLKEGKEEVIRILQCCLSKEHLIKEALADKLLKKKEIYGLYKYDEGLECYIHPRM